MFFNNGAGYAVESGCMSLCVRKRDNSKVVYGFRWVLAYGATVVNHRDHIPDHSQ